MFETELSIKLKKDLPKFQVLHQKIKLLDTDVFVPGHILGQQTAAASPKTVHTSYTLDLGLRRSTQGYLASDASTIEFGPDGKHIPSRIVV